MILTYLSKKQYCLKKVIQRYSTSYIWSQELAVDLVSNITYK